jgi:hypothetical protein
MTETFKVKVCRHFDVPPERYGDTVLALTLYPHARWLHFGAAHRLFEPDRTFIEAVGRLTRWRGLSEEVWEFRRDPRNRLLWRQSLRLRVSVTRMRALFSEVWGEPIPAGASTVEHPPHPASPFLTQGGHRS